MSECDGTVILVGLQAENPRTGQKVLARRRRIHRELELPMKEGYDEFIRQFIGSGR